MFSQILGAVHSLLMVKFDFLVAGTTGIVDYSNYDDMKYAVCFSLSVDFLIAGYNVLGFCLAEFCCIVPLQIKKLDDSEFRNAFSRAYIRVYCLLHIFFSTFCVFFSSTYNDS